MLSRRIKKEGEKQETILDKILEYFKNKRTFAYTIIICSTITFIWTFTQATIGIVTIAGSFFNSENEQIRYDFENADSGWLPQDWPGNHAIRYLYSSSQYSRDGVSSLAANIMLKGNDFNLKQGEIYVNMLNTHPKGCTAPLDLDNIQISAWIYVPKSVVKGSRFCGVQLFIKDAEWKTLYGRKIPISSQVRTGFWFVLSLVPGKELPEFGGYKDPDFNPKKVVAMGVRFMAQENKDCVYEGDIFIDSISW